MGGGGGHSLNHCAASFKCIYSFSIDMATAKNAATAAVSDPELWRDQQRFYNFLQHYDLHKYHQRFLRMGVTRLSHFKDVTDADLDAVGLTRPEKTRLRKKLEQNFSTKGKLKVSSVHFYSGETLSCMKRLSLAHTTCKRAVSYNGREWLCTCIYM